MEKERLFVVTMIRKSDGTLFFRNPMKTYNHNDAFEEAKRSAQYLSKDYKYVVTQLVNFAELESGEPPVKTTYLI